MTLVKEQPPEEIAPKEYLTPEEAQQIEDAAQCLRDKLLIRLFRKLGCRLGEVLGLEERHINFSRRQVTIQHQKERRKLSCPNCGGKLALTNLFCPQCTSRVEGAISKVTSVPHLRKVPVDQGTLQLIREYIKKGGISEVEGKRMFFTISPQWARHIVRECAERAGFYELVNSENERRHHVSPHKFRDAFVVHAVKNSPTMDDLRLLQVIMGHKSLDTTLGYRKFTGDDTRDYYDGLQKK